MTDPRRFFGLLFALARKDLRLLRAFVACLLVLTALSLANDGLFETPDGETWFDEETWSSGEAVALALSTLVLSLLAAFTLLPGEREQRTDQFVATLPVRFEIVVIVKYLVIAGTVGGMMALGYLGDFALALANPDSVARRQLGAGALGQRLGVCALVCAIAAAHAVWLAALGRLAWLVLAAVAILIGFLARLDPAFASLGLDALFRLEHHGTTAIYPWRVIVGHSAAALVALAAGVAIWRRAPEAAPDERQPGPTRGSLLRRLPATPVLIAGGVLVGVLLVAWQQLADDDETATDAPAGEVEEAPAAPHFATRRFVVTHLPGDEARARALARDAERAYDRVADFLGARGPASVVADLTFSGSELDGIALGNRMNVELGPDRSADEVRAVMMHELVHVFENALTTGASLDQVGGLRFLREGLAEYVVFELEGRATERQHVRRRAAFAHQRYKLRLADLYDAGRFVARYDERWLYDLGERWVTALVEVCGRRSVAGLFRRMAAPGLPKALVGEGLLRHVLESERCDYDRVEARYEEALRADHALVGELPAVRAYCLGRSDSGLRFAVELPPAPGVRGRVTLVLRQDPGTPPVDHVTAARDVAIGREVEIDVEAPGFGARHFQYRVGIHPQAGGGPLFSRWRSTTVD